MSGKKQTRKGKPAAKNIPAPVVELLPLALIAPDPNNPRSKMNPEKLQELAESIRQHGVLQPIAVRPEADGFIVIYGHRRRDGAVLAGLEKIPAIVYQGLSAQDILEMQVLENLQREDMDPMDEAKAFQSMIKKKGIDRLASEIGKSKRYIFDRMQLNHLVPVAQRLVSEAVLPIGHATLIAKFDEAKQRSALEFISIGHDFDDPEFDDEVNLEVLYITETKEELRRWLSNGFKPLENAPWPLDDADLHPEAGACADCSKRTRNQNLLFADLSDTDECTDRKCYVIKEEKWFEFRKAKTIEEHGPIEEANVLHYDHTRARVNGELVQITKERTEGSIPLMVAEEAGGGLKPGDVVYYVPPQVEEELDAEDEKAEYRIGHAIPQEDQEELFVRKYMQARGGEHEAGVYLIPALQLLVGNTIKRLSFQHIQQMAKVLEIESKLTNVDEPRNSDEKAKVADQLVTDILDGAGLGRSIQAYFAVYVADEVEGWMEEDEGETAEFRPVNYVDIQNVMEAMELVPKGGRLKSLEEL